MLAENALKNSTQKQRLYASITILKKEIESQNIERRQE
jgi:hypothetical protein